MTRPNIKDVAKVAGVSVASVSRVLSGKPHVSDQVRERVLVAVRELGYQPSLVAQRLRTQRSQVIGTLISDIQNPFFISLVRAIEDTASSRGYSVILCNTDEDPEKERSYLELMLAEQVAGIIITPSSEDSDMLRNLITHEFAEAKIPLVTLDRTLDTVTLDCVLLDNTRCATDLVNNLLENGHRRIGLIVGNLTSTTARQRMEGYQQALTAAGIDVEPELIHTVSPKQKSGCEATGALLSLPDPPTAIFAGNNLLIVGALEAIHEQDLRIPEDIALVGFDELSWSALYKPGLTVIAQPAREMGVAAVECLLARIAEPDRPIERLIFPGQLHVRESSGPHGEKTA